MLLSVVESVPLIMLPNIHFPLDSPVPIRKKQDMLKWDSANIGISSSNLRITGTETCILLLGSAPAANIIPKGEWKEISDLSQGNVNCQHVDRWSLGENVTQK